MRMATLGVILAVLSGGRVSAGDESGVAVVAEGINRLTFDLYGVLAEKPGNVFCSPYSGSTALAMTYAGARGETEREMRAALHFPATEELFDGLAGVRRKLKSYGIGDERRPPFTLRMVNGVWVARGYPLLPGFMGLMKTRFEAEPRELDFKGSADKAAAAINAWVKEATGRRIPELVAARGLREAKLVLTNAVYFNARWEETFDKELTRDQDFRLAGGEVVKTPTMAQENHFGYADAADCEVIELGYSGSGMSRNGNVGVTGAIAAYRNRLLQERSQVESQLAAVEQLIAAMGSVARVARGPGRPNGAAASPANRQSSSKPPTGSSLKDFIQHVLRGADVMAVKDITRGVVRAGYKSKSKTLNHAVSVALSEMKGVKKVGRGQYRMS